MGTLLVILLFGFASFTTARTIDIRHRRQLSDCENRRRLIEPEWAKPVCDPSGAYKIYQCDVYSRTNCWCVYENGQIIPGTARVLHDPHQETRDLADCEKAKKKAPPAPPPEPAPSSVPDPRLGYQLAQYENRQQPSSDSILRAIDHVSGESAGPPPCPASCPSPCPLHCIPQSIPTTNIISKTVYYIQPPAPPPPPPPPPPAQFPPSPPPMIPMASSLSCSPSCITNCQPGCHQNAIQQLQAVPCPTNCINNCPPGCMQMQTSSVMIPQQNPTYPTPQQMNAPFNIPQSSQGASPMVPAIALPYRMINPSQMAYFVAQPWIGGLTNQKYSQSQGQSPYQNTIQNGFYGSYHKNHQALLRKQRRRRKKVKKV